MLDDLVATRHPIAKDIARLPKRPNLVDYAVVHAEFDWAKARGLLDGLPGGHGLNIAHEAVDRHAQSHRGDRVALRWLGKSGERRDFTYRDLAAETSRFANVLASLDITAGSRVFVLLGRIPELYIAVLGALKAKSVVSPLFSAFGPEPIATRLEIGDGRVLVTTEALYRRKVEGLRDRLPKLEQVILVDDGAPIAGTLRWRELMSRTSGKFVIPPTSPDEMALLHFTSGTTGRPKGAIHVHEAVMTHYVTGLYALDLHDDDIFWCTADPGWVTGTSYGIIAPLTHGVTNLVVEAEFDAETWYRVLAEERVTVWYTAPTAIRMMMKLGAAAVLGHDFGALRFMASVGEPLDAGQARGKLPRPRRVDAHLRRRDAFYGGNAIFGGGLPLAVGIALGDKMQGRNALTANPEAVLWGTEAFGQPFHNNWWQTETGGIMIANFLGLAVKPGSMGLPVPGIDTATGQKGTLQIYDILNGIAPEADPASVAGDEDLREALDLDSMDFMNFVVGVHERTGIDIPEADYPRLRTMDGAIAYFGR